MTLPLEAATWTEDQIQQELAARLPKGWAFSLLKEPQTHLWVVRIFTGDVEHWRGEDAAPNLALLHALGWVVLQVTKPRTTGPWVRREELTRERVHELAARISSPEPEPADINPAEIDAVYSQRKKGGR